MAHFLIKEQHYLFLGYTMAFVRRPENILLLYTYFIREVSLYGWTTPVLLAKIHLFDYVKIIDRFTCLVKSKPVKQEVSCTVILPPSYHGVTSPRQVIFRANYFVEVLATPLANLRFGQYIGPGFVPGVKNWRIFGYRFFHFYDALTKQKEALNVDSSASTILRPRVRIPSTPYKFFQFVLLKLNGEKDENKQKEAGIGPFEKKILLKALS